MQKKKKNIRYVKFMYNSCLLVAEVSLNILMVIKKTRLSDMPRMSHVAEIHIRCSVNNYPITI